MAETPAHYRMAVEPIDAMAVWMTREELTGFYRGNAIKYVARAGKKDGAAAIDDYKKALDYLERLIELASS
jgi:hypothetical protein